LKTPAKYDLLKNNPLFKDCNEAEFQSILKDTYLRTYKEGEMFLTGDSTIHKISIVVNNGRMKIFTINPLTSEEYTLYVLSNGDLFNIITLLDGKKDNLSAMAMDDLAILHCNIDIARCWIKKYDAFNKQFLTYLSQRLRLAQEYNISKTFYSIEMRLAKLIFQNISSDNNEINLINNLSHAEIAKILGTTRTVINRNLQHLKKDGMIALKYKKIIIKDYEKLKELTEQY
jgi:CRP-like cAMP-binding protein